MKIELKSIKYAAFASQETSCYSATLYVDGKKIGTVSNEGTGGSDNFYGDHEAFRRADEWCRENLPKWKSELSGGEIDTDLEIYCGELLQTHLVTRDYKRTIRTKLLTVYPDKEGVYEIKHGGQVEDTAAKLKAVRPDAIILNMLPLDEALRRYRAGLGA